jgi:hypothetical protein
VNDQLNQLRRFENGNLELILRQLPTIHIVEDYIKNLVISLRMEK